ncbi:thiosulfate oxidation carrier protein SoxY [Pampinifervens florentissimum]|uniref:thiosulfate oxidation carrier protein SoxY n=1 Tax=Pampinifervens florentissimum TaxID=1632019 RepID=UPI0013B4A0B7|nr:thiosulfate oxidation carrier protein SoxY [Hydrogenobacter sp. T-8]QID32658.1 thiosulfate oxidation carrier protein SoxY [Hydrogenobacter sp. T-8]
MDRRKFIALSAVAVMGLTLVPAVQPAFGATKLEEEVQKRLGVKLSQIKEVADIKLTAPTIAESGANVPITVESTIPVDRVEKLWIFVDKNPVPWIADVSFTPMNGQVFFSTRIKMGETSNVRAILKLKDGSYVMATKEVKVTAGGCG